jgi:peptidoglycan/xylan/chitin deacetylase (PgdA/CDA1 family)
VPGVGRSLPYPVKAAVTWGRSAAWAVRTRGGLDGRGLRILFYHRVSDDRDELAVAPRRFRGHMDLLASEGFRVVDLVEAVRLLDGGQLPPRTVGLSFDDGYLDVREHALPVLAERGFRATVFIATGVTDGRCRFVWYRDQPPLMTWDDVAELDRGGTLTFEAHTVSHPSLLAVDDATAREEIAGSKRELEQHLGRPVTAFTFPAGLFGERERRMVAEAGFHCAFSCEPGVNRPATDRFALRRLQIDARDRLLDFRAKVGGGHDEPLPMRNAYRRVRYGAPRGGPVSRAG